MVLCDGKYVISKMSDRLALLAFDGTFFPPYSKQKVFFEEENDSSGLIILRSAVRSFEEKKKHPNVNKTC